jgi:glycosyltransferase involved in cell wall biosynthesis
MGMSLQLQRKTAKSSAPTKQGIRLAICGTRGIPACYGGFETFAEELSTRLVEKGYQVRVYGREHVINYPHDSYKGVDIKLFKAPRHKYLETPVHTLRCFIDLLFNPVDVVLVCNGANSPFAWIPRFLGRTPVAINVDGIERMRGKWNSLGKLWYRLGELCSVLLASRLVSDADVIREYYKKTYKRDSTVLRYGHRVTEGPTISRKLKMEPLGLDHSLAPGLFRELGIEEGKYLLYVSRLEPENNAHTVIQAYNKLPANLKKYPLVVVGDAPYADDYKAHLRSIAGPGVKFAGFRFGAAYELLQLGAYIYVQATEVGGTHPALVEAMGYANCIVANGTPENLEVIGEAALSYSKNDIDSLSAHLQNLLSDSDLVLLMRKNAHSRAKTLYNWDVVTEDYLKLFNELLDLPSDSTRLRKVGNS